MRKVTSICVWISFGLIDQLHHFTNQDVTLVHQLIGPDGKASVSSLQVFRFPWWERYFRIHVITSLLLAYCFVIVLVEDLRNYLVRALLRKKSQKLPALIQGFGDASVLGFGLADKSTSQRLYQIPDSVYPAGKAHPHR